VDQASQRLDNRLDQWNARVRHVGKRSQTLVYERTGQGDQYAPLLISPEHARAYAGSVDRAPFVVPNSMREVQPEINLLVSPVPERLFAEEPDGVPQWELPTTEDPS